MDCFARARVVGGIHDLPQSVTFSYEDLVKHLNSFEKIDLKPGVWKHDENGAHFTLVIDYLGVKYTNVDSLQHLNKTLERKYETTTSAEESQHAGVALELNHDKGSKLFYT